MSEKVTKQIAFDAENLEFIQQCYGAIAPSVIVNILISSLRDVLKEQSMSLTDIYKKSAIQADEQLREL